MPYQGLILSRLAYFSPDLILFSLPNRAVRDPYMLCGVEGGSREATPYPDG